MALVPLRQGDPSRIGRFRLSARLGAGGMGVVYLGQARDTGQVAIKVMRPEAGDEDEFRARFRREVALLTRVQGLCTVRVVEADTESDSPFLVTEYAAGPSLSEQVKHGGPVDPEMLVGLATGLAEALVAIHGAGVVHRDLKPGNVILTQAGPKVIDFGIAQALDGTVMTRTGRSMGSPGFMAPEQITGASGPESDIFAWGLTMAYAASGRQPFGSGPAEVLPYRIVHGTPDISAVPPALLPLVEAAVSKDPHARPTAADLMAWLSASVNPDPRHGHSYGHGHGHSHGHVEPEDDVSTSAQLVLSRTWHPHAVSELESGSASALPATWWSRVRTRALLGGAVALTVVLGAGVTYAIDAGTSKPAAAPTVTFGTYTGREPSAIQMDARSGGGTIEDIRWTSWTATSASGTGVLGSVSTRIELSVPKNGRFTRIGETTSGALVVQLYPNGDWPIGATAAVTAACTKPASARLLAAFNAASTSVRDGWTAPGANLYGFDSIECWKQWVVADVSGSGDANMVFSTSGGLHLLPQSDMQQFSAVVCSDPSSPSSWKGSDTGLAVC